jgi:D-alanyl-D-alanine carboxypeptidase
MLTHRAQPQFSASEQKQMEDVVVKVMDTFDIPGVIVGVWVPGKGTWVKGFGYANKDTKESMDPSMSFRAGSLTKTFLATVLLQLQDEGKLNLDDTVSKYSTDPKIPNADTITLRQLANMTSGLYNYSNDVNFGNAHAQNLQKNWTPKELLTIALSHPSTFVPGEAYEYSNTNYILLGDIIEKVTGNTVGTEIQKRIITPLGLSDTFYATTSDLPGNPAHGYALMDEKTKEMMDTTYDNPSWGGAAGAIVSTINDLKVWAQAMGQGKLISPEAQKQRFTWDTQPGAHYGIGTMKIGDNFVGHEGHIDGYNSVFFYLPSKNAVIVVMQNLNPSVTEGIAGNIAAALAKIVLPNDVNW